MHAERLPMVAPEIADMLQRASEPGQRRGAVAAASLVVERAVLDDGRVKRALSLLRNGETDEKLRLELERWVEELDDSYWDLQAAYEQGQRSEADYLAAFGLARSVSSVCFGLHPDALHGAMEAVYEAHCAFSDGSGVLDAVASALAS